MMTAISKMIETDLVHMVTLFHCTKQAPAG